jgi:hypothetical protein
MNKILFCFLLVFSACLSAGIPVDGQYPSPTKKLIERESWQKISRAIKKMSIPNELIPLFNDIADQENWGHIGYHGANQGYRIYQDIIRFTVEEILGIDVPDNFHFFRIPGDDELNLNSMDEFIAYWGKKKVDNKSSKRAKQLLSLNFGIYSNFDQKGSCSISLFVKDKSKTKINYAKTLEPFYASLGIKKSELAALFSVARKWLDEDGGILLQISENSYLTDPNYEAYNFADGQCYPAKRGGHRFGTWPISNHYDRMMADAYLDKKVDIAPQLRLLINNRYTLNPFSHLQVSRWDLYNTETILQYEEEMRENIRNIKYDIQKAEEYREKLFELWF